MTAGDHPASAQEALLALAAEFEAQAAGFADRWVNDTATTLRDAAELARQRAQEHATAASEAQPVSLDGQNGSVALSGEEWIISHVAGLANTTDTVLELLTVIGLRLFASVADHPAAHPAAVSAWRQRQDTPGA